jgi:hypothetical protein
VFRAGKSPKRKSMRGEVKIIASIEDPDVVKKILDHLDTKTDAPVNHLSKSRAPPQQGLLFTGE